MFIRTERLFLRPAFPEDWGEMFAGICDEAIVRNLARVPWPYAAEDARKFCARPFDPRAPSLLVTLPGATGAPIVGRCGYGPREDSGEIELGFWIARDCWGRGFATEAARALVGFARIAGPAHLAAGHFADNAASGKVLARAGFRPTGAIRMRYSLGRGDHAPSVEYRLSGEGADCRAGVLAEA